MKEHNVSFSSFELLFVTTGLTQAFEILSMNSCNRAECFVLNYLIDKFNEVIPDGKEK